MNIGGRYGMHTPVDLASYMYYIHYKSTFAADRPTNMVKLLAML